MTTERIMAWLTDDTRSTYGAAVTRIMIGFVVSSQLLLNWPDRSYTWGEGSRWNDTIAGIKDYPDFFGLFRALDGWASDEPLGQLRVADDDPVRARQPDAAGGGRQQALDEDEVVGDPLVRAHPVGHQVLVPPRHRAGDPHCGPVLPRCREVPLANAHDQVEIAGGVGGTSGERAEQDRAVQRSGSGDVLQQRGQRRQLPKRSAGRATRHAAAPPEPGSGGAGATRSRRPGTPTATLRGALAPGDHAR